MKKLCICSATDVGYYDDKYNWCGYKNAPETIHWCKKSDGSFETGSLRNEEIEGKIKCQCGKYMKTHLHEHTQHDKQGYAFGKSWYEMIATCSCNNPKPHIMECKCDESINECLNNITKNIEKIKTIMKGN